MLLFCKKNNVEVSAYSVLTPTFIIEPFLSVQVCSLCRLMPSHGNADSKKDDPCDDKNVVHAGGRGDESAQ